MNIIELEEEEASLFGYVVSATEKNIQNYLAENFCFEIAFFVQDAIERLGKPVALLRNMYVDESAQGKGLGSLLLSRFMDEATLLGAEEFLLVADTAEVQRDGFDLVSWYELFGFQTVIANPGGFPLMVSDGDLLKELMQLEGAETNPLPPSSRLR